MAISSISAAEFKDCHAPHLTIIDVRSPQEFAKSHVQGAKNIPLEQLQPELLAQKISADETVFLICKAGMRAKHAANQLSQFTDSPIVVIEGGTVASIDAGCPCHLEHSSLQSSVISIERQVRITAGLMGLTGTLLGLLVHSGFFVMPAFIGAGLTFAGITDSCAMGALLLRMPWNKS